MGEKQTGCDLKNSQAFAFGKGHAGVPTAMSKTKNWESEDVLQVRSGAIACLASGALQPRPPSKQAFLQRIPCVAVRLTRGGAFRGSSFGLGRQAGASVTTPVHPTHRVRGGVWGLV